MDRFLVMQDGRTVGELTVSPDGLYQCYSLVCRPWGQGVRRAFLVGESGEMRLGIPVPSGGNFGLCRKISLRETEPLGKLQCVQLRLCGESAEPWEETERPETLLRDPFLRARLREVKSAKMHRTFGGVALAIPFDCKKPFPIPALFCFARIRCVCGVLCAVYAFDDRENPIIR